MRLPTKVEYTSYNEHNQEEEDQEGLDPQKTEERQQRPQNTASLRRSLDPNKLKNGGSFLGTLLNYGGTAVGFGPEDAARAEHQRMVAERKGHSSVYPYFKLDNPIMYQSSQFQTRPQTSGSSQRGIGGILTGGAEIDHADEVDEARCAYGHVLVTTEVMLMVVMLVAMKLVRFMVFVMDWEEH